jgi:hypothetical protein
MAQREEFQDTKGVIRITKSTTERQYNAPARRVSRYQRSNQNNLINNGKTIQWPSEKSFKIPKE